jgi:23S rRNA (pseudouridine1915-N3)-methyltransferase
MRLLVPFLGKTREPFVDAGIQEYARRLQRYTGIDLPVLKERRGKNDGEEMVKQLDGVVLLERTKIAAVRIALDPGGRMVGSEELAVLLKSWEVQGAGIIALLIGGHLGLHRSVLEQVDLTLSLSRLTFTHEMTRLILLEQLYRACTINAGQKYHK